MGADAGRQVSVFQYHGHQVQGGHPAGCGVINPSVRAKRHFDVNRSPMLVTNDLRFASFEVERHLLK
ncbi:hypothetical protein X805_30930 [Sphaerotilus natans subsp. natans DSM 6575]|uniref:Uncharacterized protein n=1 Tax=Sphaerotilus natans subsp. natans DSM 6575 TaxID=1286631 RepID=A0A059KIM5_9BURK|nr:hypothetical protein X805_30930 [Sphaerotilus natans subsp. natans DSM 6575]